MGDIWGFEIPHITERVSALLFSKLRKDLIQNQKQNPHNQKPRSRTARCIDSYLVQCTLIGIYLICKYKMLIDIYDLIVRLNGLRTHLPIFTGKNGNHHLYFLWHPPQHVQCYILDNRSKNPCKVHLDTVRIDTSVHSNYLYDSLSCQIFSLKKV